MLGEKFVEPDGGGVKLPSQELVKSSSAVNMVEDDFREIGPKFYTAASELWRIKPEEQIGKLAVTLALSVLDKIADDIKDEGAYRPIDVTGKL